METRQRNFLVVVGLFVGGKLIDALIGDATSRAVGRLLSGLKLDAAAIADAIDHFWWGALAILIVWGVLEFSYFLARRKRVALLPKALPEYTETRLRIRRDTAGTGHYLQVGQSNIDHWQQVFFHMGPKDSGKQTGGEQDYLIHIDTLAMTFEKPTDYERPIIEAFGHDIPAYTFFSLGRGGALFQFVDAIKAPVLEVRFPPPGHYARLGEMEGMEPVPTQIHSELVISPKN